MDRQHELLNAISAARRAVRREKLNFRFVVLFLVLFTAMFVIGIGLAVFAGIVHVGISGAITALVLPGSLGMVTFAIVLFVLLDYMDGHDRTTALEKAQAEYEHHLNSLSDKK
jgi:hypothetical protein